MSSLIEGVQRQELATRIDRGVEGSLLPKRLRQLNERVRGKSAQALALEKEPAAWIDLAEIKFLKIVPTIEHDRTGEVVFLSTLGNRLELVHIDADQFGIEAQLLRRNAKCLRTVAQSSSKAPDRVTEARPCLLLTTTVPNAFRNLPALVKLARGPGKMRE